MDQSYNYGLTPDQLSAPPTPVAAPAAAPQANSGFSSLLPASSAKYEEQSGKHKGVAGTARDILGFLGDFLLTRMHMKPMYSTSQEDRKEHAALAGFGADPQSTADALSRLDDLNPTRADKVRDTYLDNQRLAQNAASIQDARKAREDDLKQRGLDRQRMIGTSALNSLTDPKLSPDKRAELYPVIRAQVLKAAPSLAAELPPTYDSNIIDTILDSGVTVGVQRGQRLTEKKIDNQDDQAEARIGETVKHDRATEGTAEERIGVAKEGNRIREKSVEYTNSNAKERTQIMRDRPTPTPRRPPPTAAEMQALRANPEARDYFDEKHGLGASKKILGN